MTGTSHHSCVRCPNTTPISLTWFILSFQGVLPFTRHSPLSGVRIPLRILIVELFPAPLGPIYPTISPSPMVKLTWSKALMVSYSLVNRVRQAALKPAFLFATWYDLQMPSILIIAASSW